MDGFRVTRIGLLLAIGTVSAAVVVLSGSQGLAGSVGDDQAFVAARSELVAALDRAGQRLDRLSVAAGDGAIHDDDNGLGDAIESLESRRTAIMNALDSIAESERGTWRGAMPGLRASVADLEARVDRAEFEALDSIPAVDTLLRAWLESAGRVLDRLGQPYDTAAFGAHAPEIRELRRARTTIAQRLAEVSAEDDDPELRQRLADELIALRRQVRALERATGQGAHRRSP